MAWWRTVQRVPVLFPRVCCGAALTVGRCKELMLRSTSTKSSVPKNTRDPKVHNVEVSVTQLGSTIVCFHPAPAVSYELTEPLPRESSIVPPAETHHLLLKSRLSSSIHPNKEQNLEELSKLFYTTKHRWYPIGQYHTRRRNRNPPRER